MSVLLDWTAGTQPSLTLSTCIAAALLLTGTLSLQSPGNDPLAQPIGVFVLIVNVLSVQAMRRTVFRCMRSQNLFVVAVQGHHDDAEHQCGGRNKEGTHCCVAHP